MRHHKHFALRSLDRLPPILFIASTLVSKSALFFAVSSSTPLSTLSSNDNLPAPAFCHSSSLITLSSSLPSVPDTSLSRTSSSSLKRIFSSEIIGFTKSFITFAADTSPVLSEASAIGAERCR